jgi:co-chaperonin GroES (HSP10)
MKYDIDLSPDERDAALSVLQPTGYRLLVAIARIKEKQGMIYIPEQAKAAEEVAAILGTVVAMGKDAYTDPDKFPGGPYCGLNDVIMMASYSGRRMKIGDREFRLINDDTVMAVVSKPEEIERA